MARRSKAANRKARQRKAQSRSQTARGQAHGPVVGAAPQPLVSDAEQVAVEQVGTAAAPSRSATVSPSAAARARRGELAPSVGGPSRLSERAASEYHYVVRDLRNIGILVVILAGLLAAAAVAVNVLHLIPT